MRGVLLWFAPLVMALWAYGVKAADMESAQYERAIFAGGCFWCTESAFDYADGVMETVSGYTGGVTKNPSYEEVSSGASGHYEALEVIYDPQKISYNALLAIFWKSIDPTDGGGQFADRGSQYRTAIFYDNSEQQEEAEASKLEVAKRLNADIKTEILPASEFYPAEEYHQNYHEKNPLHYKLYSNGSGRPERLREIWGDEK